MVQDESDRAVSLRFAATAAVDRSGDEVARGWLLNNLGTLHGQRREYEAQLTKIFQHHPQANGVSEFNCLFTHKSSRSPFRGAF